jgi:hypothetical protein
MASPAWDMKASCCYKILGDLTLRFAASAHRSAITSPSGHSAGDLPFAIGPIHYQGTSATNDSQDRSILRNTDGNAGFCHSPAPVWLSLAIIGWGGRITDAIDGTFMEVDHVRIDQAR